MTSTTRILRTLPPQSPPRVRRRRWFSVLLAMATATAVSALADPIAGIDLVVEAGDGTRTVDQLPVTLTALAAGLGAWGLLELLERWTRRSHLIWRVVACVVFVISLSGPLAATTDAAIAVLTGLHLLVGGILMVGLGGSPRLETPSG